MRNLLSAVLLLLALPGLWTGGAARAQDDTTADPGTAAVAPAGAVQIALPFNKAIVRESVPVKLRDFPADGYVAVSIDGQFITAQALPRKRTDPVYVWDTKAAYATPDDPNTPQYYTDGAHAITIIVYDAQSKMVGKDTVQVQVANKINLPASQGIKLAYPWSLSTRLLYQRRTLLTATPADAPASDPGQTLQESLLRYRRTVENASGSRFLIRDEALPVDKTVKYKTFVSYVSTHNQTQTLENLGAIRAKYRMVDKQGHVLSEIGADNGGNQIGFSLPVLPPRRISVGAHWDTPVQMTFDWASPYPTTVTATSTLEDFEWQDRYPTAKIRETYTGPASFQPSPGSPLPRLSSQDIKFERIIYFAYNAGRIVRMQTTLSLSTTTPGLLFSSPNGSGNPGMGLPGQTFPGQSGPTSGFPGMSGPNPGFPNQIGTSDAGVGGQPIAFPGFPGMGGQPQPRPMGQRPRPGFPGAGFPGSGGFPGNPGNPGNTPTVAAPVKLKYLDTSVIIL